MSTSTVEGNARRILEPVFGAGKDISTLISDWRRSNPALFRDARWWEYGYTFPIIVEGGNAASTSTESIDGGTAASTMTRTFDGGDAT